MHTPSNAQQPRKKNPPWISSCSAWLLQYLHFLLHHRLPMSLRERRLLRSPGHGTLLYCRLPRCPEPGVIWLHHLFNNSKHRRGSEWFTPQCRWAQNADAFFAFLHFFSPHVRYLSSFSGNVDYRYVPARSMALHPRMIHMPVEIQTAVKSC